VNTVNSLKRDACLSSKTRQVVIGSSVLDWTPAVKQGWYLKGTEKDIKTNHSWYCSQMGSADGIRFQNKILPFTGKLLEKIFENEKNRQNFRENLGENFRES
jgi:hypothetical protein